MSPLTADMSILSPDTKFSTRDSMTHRSGISIVPSAISEGVDREPFSNRSSQSANCVSPPSVLMFFVNVNCFIVRQIGFRLMEALMMADREALDTTGKTCMKPPPRSMVFPPKGIFFFPIISPSKRLTSVRWRLGDMGASSQTIKDASLRSLACGDPSLIDETDVSLKGTGSLKSEWHVLPPGSKVDAIPVGAQARAVFSWPRKMCMRDL